MSGSRAVVINSMELLNVSGAYGTAYKASFKFGAQTSNSVEFVSTSAKLLSQGPIIIQGPIILHGLQNDCQFEVVIKSKSLMSEKLLGMAVFATNNLTTTAGIDSSSGGNIVGQLQVSGSVVSESSIPSQSVLSVPNFFSSTKKTSTAASQAVPQSQVTSQPVVTSAVSSNAPMFSISPTVPKFNVLIVTIGRGDRIPCVEGTGATKTSDVAVKIKVGNVTQRTEVIEDSPGNPEWNQKFFFASDNRSGPVSIKFTVEDNNVTMNETLGEFEISDALAVLNEKWQSRVSQARQREAQLTQLMNSPLLPAVDPSAASTTETPEQKREAEVSRTRKFIQAFINHPLRTTFWQPFSAKKKSGFGLMRSSSGSDDSKKEDPRIFLQLSTIYTGSDVVDISSGYIQGEKLSGRLSDKGDDFVDNDGDDDVEQDAGGSSGSHGDEDDDDDDDDDDGSKKKKKKKIPAEESKDGKSSEGEAKDGSGEPELTEEEKKAIEMIEKIEVHDGDYQIQVHVIEVRDLHPEDVNGSADPVVAVHCFGQKQYTKIHRNCVSAIFDQVFYFNLPAMTRNSLEQGSGIEIKVYDADLPAVKSTSESGGGTSFLAAAAPKELIGSFATDFETVYFTENHELYRQWAPLIDMDERSDVGVQGYLLLSATIIGPRDKIPVHDRQAEKSKENAEKKSPSDGISSVMTPKISQTLMFLSVAIYEAEHLPAMDRSALGRLEGIDAYVKVEFSTNKPMKSKVVTSKTGALNSVQFNQCLVLPYMSPTFTNSIRLSVWDYDRTTDEIVATAPSLKLKDVERNPAKFKSFWINLYGAPLPDSVMASIPIAEQKKLMNSNPQVATHYRGRIRIGLCVYDNKGGQFAFSSSQSSSQGSESILSMMSSFTKAAGTSGGVPLPFKVPIDKLLQQSYKKKLTKPLKAPPTSSYILRAIVYSASDLPKFTIKSNKFAVRISVGVTSLITQGANAANGVCTWNDGILESPQLELARDASSIPDLIIHLLQGGTPDGDAICYYRVPASLFTSLGSNCFGLRPRWLTLKRDSVNDAVAADEWPGSILIKLGFGPVEYATQQPWPFLAPGNEIPHQLRVHVFQGRGLPSADDNGLLDPYLKVLFNGEVQQTRIKEKTRDPCYYETLTIDVNLRPDTELMPLITMQVMDYDTYSADDMVGIIRVPVEMCTVIRSADASLSTYPTPQWFPVVAVGGGDVIRPPEVDFGLADPFGGRKQSTKSYGHVLMSFSIVQKAKNQTLPPLPDLVPQTRPHALEIMLLGLRELLGNGIVGLTRPYIEFRLGDGPLLKKTAPSGRPSSSNPNYCERITETIQLPENPMFAPCLNVTVFDKQFGGLRTALVGTCSVPLDRKMPMQWRKQSSSAVAGDAVDNPCYRPPGGSLKRDNHFLERELESPIPSQTVEEEKVTLDIESKIPMQETAANLASLSVGVVKAKEAAHRPNQSQSSNSPNMARQFTASSYSSEASSRALETQDSARQLAKPAIEEKKEGNTPGASSLDEDIEFYMVGRKSLVNSVEDNLESTPFECYPIYRGDMMDGSYHQAGYMKAIVTIAPLNIDSSMLRNAQNGINWQSLKTPTDVSVRLYVLKGTVAPKDDNGLSDPYLKVSLGSSKINDIESVQERTLRPTFFKRFDFVTTIPGAPELKIDVFDKDMFSDDLIGQTVVDLEDRWFCQQWQNMGMSNVGLPVNGKVKGPLKPVEVRLLYSQETAIPQGKLLMWLDIMSAADSRAYPSVDIKPPPKTDFEVRLIIWKAKDFPPGDWMTGMTDLFFKCRLGGSGSRPQETDIHFRCAEGAMASFNWRMKFPISLPLSDDQEGQSYLNIQAYDMDILFNDCLADCTFELDHFLVKAFKKHAKSQESKADSKNVDVALDDSVLYSVFTEMEKEERLKLNSLKNAASDALRSVGTHLSPKLNFFNEATGFGNDTKEADDIESKGVSETTALLHESGGSRKRNEKGAGVKVESKADNKKDKGKRRKNQPTIYDRVMNAMGYGPDPENSKWLKLTSRSGDVVQQRGEVLVSIEIMPQSYADQLRLGGIGRSEPNTNPEMPEPEGRPDLTKLWNPFYLCKTCIGEKLFVEFQIIICCAIIVVVYYFAGPTIVSFIQFMGYLPYNIGYYLALIVFCLLAVCLCYCKIKCQQVCCTAGKKDDEHDEEIEMTKTA